MNSKRLFLLISLLVLASMLAAQCAAPASPPEKVVETVVVEKEVEKPVVTTVEVEKEVVVTATPEPMAPVRFDGTTLYISAIEGGYMNVFNQWADEIFDKYGIKMEFDTVSVTESFRRDMLEFNTLSSSHDIVLINPGNVPDYSVHLEPLLPLAEKWGLDFQLDDAMPAFRDLGTWNGVLLALPFDGAQHSILYRKSAFENPEYQDRFKAEYGYDLAPPETWDQYRDVAEFFTGWDWDNDGQDEYGTAEAWRRGLWSYIWWVHRFLAYGGVYFDEDMNPLVNSPAGLKALENMLAVKDFVPPGTPNFTNPEVKSFFFQGDTAMLVNWSSIHVAAMDPERSKVVGDAMPYFMPGVMYQGEVNRRPSLHYGWVAGIPRYSQNKDAALHVLWYVSQPEHVLQSATNPKTELKPWRPSALQSEAWYQKWEGYDDFTDQYIKVMSETPTMAVGDLQLPGAAEYIDKLDEQISLALAGEKSPQQALDDAAAAWNEVTDRFDREKQMALWNLQYNALKARGIKYEPDIAQQ